jgi:signal peptidase I
VGDLAVGARSGSGAAERPGERGDEGPEEGDGKPTAEKGSGEGAKAKKHRSFWKELSILIGIALVLALAIKTFLVQAFSIPSDSMQDTLQRGDRVLVDKLTPWFDSKPERGEIVVFHDPGGWLDGTTVSENFLQRGLSFIGLMPSVNDKDLIKRVIAVGGDTVECAKGEPVKVNGRALDEEPYLFPGDPSCDDRPFGPVEVPEGRLWVMGDHRGSSRDSRAYAGNADNGTVPADRVIGRAFVIVWPLDRAAVLRVPATFDGPLGAMPVAVQAGLVGSTPYALGLVGALPVVAVRRRLRHGRRLV